MKTTLYVAVLALALASSGLTTASSPHGGEPTPDFVEVHDGAYIVPSGDLRVLEDTIRIEATTIDVQGTLQAPLAQHDGATIELVATDRITVGGAILGADGRSHGGVDAAIAPDGGDGSSIILRAPEIVIEPGAYIQPGHGGRGGAALPTMDLAGGAVRGGDGGDAGWIVLDGHVVSLPPMGGVGAAHLGNAMGGDGGQARATGTGASAAHGGDGGHYGTILATGNATAEDLGGRMHHSVAASASRDLIPASWIDSLLGLYADLYYSIVPTHPGGGNLPDLVPAIDCIGDCNPDSPPVIVLQLIRGDGPCTGADGADADNSGADYGGAAGNGGHGTSTGHIGGPGEAGDNASGSGRNAGLATGGNGEDGCWNGNGGDGGDATANGGSGQAGGDGGNGGSGLIGGNGGVGGSAGSSGNGGTATGGHPGCGGMYGRSGAPGTAAALGGSTSGGAGGKGGKGTLANGAPGAPGASSEGAAGVMSTQPTCVN